MLKKIIKISLITADYLRHAWWGIRQPVLLGVRVLVIDEQKKEVLLVKHTYCQGWHLPGGGVGGGERLSQAAARELCEEAGIKATSKPRFLSYYYNKYHGMNDHIMLFAVDEWAGEAKPDSWEIAEAKFFSLDDLPADITKATKHRIEENLGKREETTDW